MKKFLALLLAVMMIASMSITVFADNGSDSTPANDLAADLGGAEGDTLSKKDVTVIADGLSGTNKPDTVYHVVVTWASLDFTFKFDTALTDMVWDPVSHTYMAPDGADEGTELDALTGKWANGDATTETKANAVTVVNHSNATVNVNATVSKTEATNGVLTKVALAENDSGELASAEGKALDAAEITCVYNVTVEGTPTIVTQFTVDTVTLTIGA